MSAGIQIPQPDTKKPKINYDQIGLEPPSSLLPESKSTWSFGDCLQIKHQNFGSNQQK